MDTASLLIHKVCSKCHEEKLHIERGGTIILNKGNYTKDVKI
jgi:hypothetical protein